MLTLIVGMQHITLALISARREAMRTRVWSIGFVALSPRKTFCFLFLSFSIVPDTYHKRLSFYLYHSQKAAAQWVNRVGIKIVRVYICVILTLLSWKATHFIFYVFLVGLNGGRRAFEMNHPSI